jgi:hypothetical protein
MKFGTLSISALILVSTPLLIAKPAFSAEKVLSEHSAFIHTTGPVTQSLYFQKGLVKTQAAFIRRNPGALPNSFCDEIPSDPIGITKFVCKVYSARVDRILEAAKSNSCLKVRFPHGFVPGGIISSVTVDKSKFCK